jgi:ABC-2 type transport system permease protein
MAFWTLYKRELNSYFNSIVAYIVLFGSALVQSCAFIIIIDYLSMNNIRSASVLQVFFAGVFFWILALVQVPLITMRVFSEEFKLGTIEMLLTAPVREWDVVLAKFFGALTFFLVLWLPIILNLTSLQLFSNPPPPLIWSEIGLTALTVTLIGSFYVSIGVFTSVITKNQIVAAVLSFALLFATFSVEFLRMTERLDNAQIDLISYVSPVEHIQNATQGLFDTRPIVFYATITAFMLMLTQRILQGRRLKG